MSALSDEYIKNFSDERKALFNKKFRDDYDPNESEEINIIRIINDLYPKYIEPKMDSTYIIDEINLGIKSFIINLLVK